MRFCILFVAFASLAVVPACAQSSSVENLPICMQAGYPAAPLGPMWGWVVDVNTATAVNPTYGPNIGLTVLAHAFRSVAPGEEFRLRGEGLAPYGSAAPVTAAEPTTSLNGITVLFNGKPAGLTFSGINTENPVEIAAPNQLNGIVPPDLKADSNGNVVVALLGQNSDGSPCRGFNTPFTLKFAAVVDAVFNFPLDQDHPLVSGWVKINRPAKQAALSLNGEDIPLLDFQGESAATTSYMSGTAVVKDHDGNYLATFPVPRTGGVVLRNHR